MSHAKKTAPKSPKLEVEELLEMSEGDLLNLCEATEAAIQEGGGFGWLDLPERDTLARFWQGVLVNPHRRLYVARLDDVICGAAQLILPLSSNQAQNHSGKLTNLFITPWARGYGLARKLLMLVEKDAAQRELCVLNCDVRKTQQAMIGLLQAENYEKFGTNPNYSLVKGTYVPGLYFTKKLA